MVRVLVALLAAVIVSFSLASVAAAVKPHTNANLSFRSGGEGSQGGGAGGRTAIFPAGYQTTGGSGRTRSGGNCAVIFEQPYCHGKGFGGP